MQSTTATYIFVFRSKGHSSCRYHSMCSDNAFILQLIVKQVFTVRYENMKTPYRWMPPLCHLNHRAALIVWPPWIVLKVQAKKIVVFSIKPNVKLTPKQMAYGDVINLMAKSNDGKKQLFYQRIRSESVGQHHPFSVSIIFVILFSKARWFFNS